MMQKQEQIEYEKRLSKYWWSRWQRIKRHPDYVAFCDTKDFDKDNRLIEKPEFAEELAGVKKRFGLRTVYHYSQDFSEQQCFENYDIFDDSEIVLRIWPEVDIDPDGPQSFRSEGLPGHGTFICLGIKIDPEINLQDIKAKVECEVKYARAVRDMPNEDSRLQLNKHADYYSIWDARGEKKPFSVIAQSMGLSEDTAKRRFYRAYELITGEHYDKKTWAELVYRKLRQIAQARGADGGAWERFLDLEEGKSQEVRYSETAPIKEDGSQTSIEDLSADIVESSSIFADPKVRWLLQDIEKTCQDCTDKNCFNSFKKAVSEGDLSKWIPCPKILDEFLKS